MQSEPCECIRCHNAWWAFVTFGYLPSILIVLAVITIGQAKSPQDLRQGHPARVWQAKLLLLLHMYDGQGTSFHPPAQQHTSTSHHDVATSTGSAQHQLTSDINTVKAITTARKYGLFSEVDRSALQAFIVHSDNADSVLYAKGMSISDHDVATSTGSAQHQLTSDSPCNVAVRQRQQTSRRREFWLPLYAPS